MPCTVVTHRAFALVSTNEYMVQHRSWIVHIAPRPAKKLSSPAARGKQLHALGGPQSFSLARHQSSPTVHVCFFVSIAAI